MSVAVEPQGSAVSTASVDPASLLLELGHSPDKSNPRIPSPLYRAVDFNKPDVALALIRAGCDVRPMSKKMLLRFPPVICLAADLNQTEVVLELCKNTQCDIFARNDQQQTIVHLAVLRGNYDLVQRLPWQCLGRVGASAASNQQLYRFLMNFSTMADGQFITPLEIAASQGDLTMLKLLLTIATFFKTHLTLDETDTLTGESLRPRPAAGVHTHCARQSKPPAKYKKKRKPPVENACTAVSCLEGTCASLPNSCCMTDSASRFPNSPGTVGTAGTVASDGSVSTAGRVASDGTVASDGRVASDGTVATAGTVASDGTAATAGRVASDGSVSTAGRVASDGTVATAGRVASDGTAATASTATTAGSALSMDDKLNLCVAHITSAVKTDCRRDSNSFDNNNAGSWECRHPTCSPAHQAMARKQLINCRMLGSKETLLHFATMEQRLDVMEFLIGEGAEVNVQNAAGNTALHLLAMEDWVTAHRAPTAARLLLKAGADCNLKGSLQQPVRLFNNTRPHPYVTVYPRPDEKGLTVVMMAALRNNVEYLKLLSEFGARFDEVNKANMTILMLALKHGKEEAVLFLLNHHPENATFHAWVDKRGFTALHYVSNCKNIAGELAERLLSEGYEIVRGKWPSARRCACGIGRVHGESYNFNCPLVCAVRHRKFAVLQALVRHRPDLLTCSENVLLSPLHAVLVYILGEESAHFIDFLLAHGADGNAVVCERTPYELAAMLFGQERLEILMYAAHYLRKKLGSVFLLPDLAHFEDHRRRRKGENDGVESVRSPALRPRERGVKVLSLSDACCSVVRRSVRETRGDYYAQITSLPLPGRVIDYLLFKTGV